MGGPSLSELNDRWQVRRQADIRPWRPTIVQTIQGVNCPPRARRVTICNHGGMGTGQIMIDPDA